MVYRLDLVPAKCLYSPNSSYMCFCTPNFKVFISYVCMCVCEYMSIHHMYAGALGVSRGCQVPGAGVKVAVSYHVGTGTLGPLREQRALFSAEPSLHPHPTLHPGVLILKDMIDL